MRFVRMAVAAETRVSAQDLTPLLSALLSPASVVALALAFWRLGADLNWTGEFAISSGLFSHWQVWMALAVGLQTWAAHLSKKQRNSRH